MSGEWSKDQVLQSYLNIIYFGRGSYGISAGAKAYFDKPVEQLTVAEGALLAALIQQPSGLDPANNPEGAVERWNWVLDGMVEIGALSPTDRAAQVFPPTVAPELARSQNQTNGPNGLIERQVQKELLELFDISEQTLNTEGLQITTTIDPKAQQAAEEAAAENLDGQDPDMRTAIVSIDPRTGGVKAYYGGTDANGFDFAQAGLQTGSSFKVFALVAALQQGMGLGFQVDSSPVTENGITITNVEGAGCGTCNIAEALKRSLNTAYYRLMLKLENGPADVAEAAHQAGIAESFPGVDHTLSEDGQGGPPNNGIVLGQYQTRPIDMASAYATLAASGVYHKPHFVQKVVNSAGEVLFDASQQNNEGEQRIDKAVADNVISAMQPIAAYSNGHTLAGGRPSAAKTGTVQLGDTGDNRDAWMVGVTPSLSTAVWVGTTEGTKPLQNSGGSPIYGSGLPSDIWKATMDGALEDTEDESFPKPEEIGGYAGVPQAPPPPTSTPPPPPPSETVIQPTIEVAPGITIPIGPPTTVPVAPPVPVGPPPGPPGAPGVPWPGSSSASRLRDRRPRTATTQAGRRRRRRFGGADVESPARPAADRRSLDDRDLPSRTDSIGAALSEVIGGPVGRHALIGRQRFLTPLRVMLIIALVLLALGYSTKAACLQTTGKGTADQRVGNWENQRAYYELCYSDTVPLYTAELLNLGKFPYKSSWIETDATGKPHIQYDGNIAVRYMEYPVLTGVYQYLSMALAKTYTALTKLVAAPIVAEVVMFFNIAAFGLALAWLATVWATAQLAGSRRVWDAALVAASPIVIFQIFTNFDALATAFATGALLAWARRKPMLAGALIGLGVAAKLYPLLLLAPLAVLAVRTGKLREVGKTAVAAVVTWVLVNLPIMILFPRGWSEFFRLNTRRGDDMDSLYNVVKSFTGWRGFDPDLGFWQPPTVLNTVSAALFVSCCIAIAYIALTAKQRPRVAQVAFLVVAAFLLTNKVWSPQFSLWLVPLAVLALPHRRILLAWMTIDALVWVPRMLFLYGEQNRGLPEQPFTAMVLLRDIAVIGSVRLGDPPDLSPGTGLGPASW